jgi:mRNA interferase MazF
MSEGENFLRGDVILVSVSFVTDATRTKMRPAVIVQNDIGNRYSPNLIVVAISSRNPRRVYPTNFVVPEGSAEATSAGLDRTSVVQAEVVLTIPKSAVVRRLGRFSDRTMEAIDRCLRVSLALLE